ncbi:hypothetical protein GCM10010178_49680 [Lentzea flava]|uniref:Uncharacterized protein n=1 Tax=Lentzea flava TaxID=103732 RepID=A0ABQ2USW9_9PSEU|nr:hypothetical protein [Lentzea flava]GGU50961.1 hypothetical protein GCM10010178_49680 [Lentzea flava]
MDFESWFQYNFIQGKVMYYQVKHVWDVQNRIESTKPGDKFAKVAGGRGSGRMLRNQPLVGPPAPPQALRLCCPFRPSTW